MQLVSDYVGFRAWRLGCDCGLEARTDQVVDILVHENGCCRNQSMRSTCIADVIELI